MLVYYFVPFIVNNRYLLFQVSSGQNSVTVQNRTHVYMKFFDHKDIGNHLLQLCPKVVKHPVYSGWSRHQSKILGFHDELSGNTCESFRDTSTLLTGNNQGVGCDAV